MTKHNHHSRLWPGVALALGSAILFGAATPLSKILLGSIEPQLLAGLLYLGAGMGLAALQAARALLAVPGAEAPLRRTDLPWLAVAILAGGIAGPVLLMLGLARIDAASASLLLNLEGLATMSIAWLIFWENVDRRLLLGALAIIAGAIVLSWNGQRVSLNAGTALIGAACIAWGIDNNVTRKLSATNPVSIAMVKGLVAGVVNIAVAITRSAVLPDAGVAAATAVLGFFAIGVSLVMFVLALRHLGAARTGAYFSLAPFVGALIAVAILQDPVSFNLIAAALLMGFGLWMHLTERHAHWHDHEEMDHEHSHVHDEHHQHDHDGAVTEPHSHRHRHAPMRHKHPHYPDLHHRHAHH